MPLVALLALLVQPPALVERLDSLAQARDAASLAALAAPAPPANGFRWIKTGGPYETGKFGWRALPLKDETTDEQLVVFSTPTTGEDLGEQVFRLRNGRIELVPEEDPQGWSMPHLAIQARFNLEQKKAMLTIAAQVKRGEKAGMLLPRFSPNYRVLSLKDEAGKPVPFAQAGGVVSIKAPAQAVSTLTFELEGTVDRPHYAGSISPKEVQLTNDGWWPQLGRQPATFTLSMDLPKGWTGITNGAEVRRDQLPDGGARLHYSCPLPISVLSLSAGPYTEVVRTINGRPYRMLSSVMSREDMELQCLLFSRVVEFWDKIHPLPFSGYGAVVSEVYGGGALEAYSYATYGAGWLPDEDPHEPSHTCWGGVIPNRYLRSFWNESFAVFSEGFYKRETAVGNRADRRLIYTQDVGVDEAWNASPIRTGGPFIGPPAAALGYGKGGFVLDQLEREAGTAQMTAWLRAWLGSHEPGRLGEWEDFERVCGPEWKWFFRQWLDGKGWPAGRVKELRLQGGNLTGKMEFDGPPWRAKLAVWTDAGMSWAQVDESGSIRGVAPAGAARAVLDPWSAVLAGDADSDGRFGAARRKMKRAAAARVDPAAKDVLYVVEPAAGTALERSLPGIAALLNRAGIALSGETAHYRGQQVSLRAGMVAGSVRQPGGGRIGFMVGKTRLEPKMGAAAVAMMDATGRVLAGVREPRTDRADLVAVKQGGAPNSKKPAQP